MWSKSTLEGVWYVVSSRKIMPPSKMGFQFIRSGFSIMTEDEVVNEFELSLMRPLGVNIAGEYIYAYVRDICHIQRVF